MNWRLIGMCAAAGIVPGVTTALGWIGPGFGQAAMWWALAIGIAVAASRHARDAAFSHALLGTLGAGFVAGDVQALVLFDQYLANNPEFANATAQSFNGTAAEGETAAPRRTLLVLGGVATGMFYGVFAAIGAMLMARRPRSAPHDDGTAHAMTDESEE